MCQFGDVCLGRSGEEGRGDKKVLLHPERLVSICAACAIAVIILFVLSLPNGFAQAMNASPGDRVQFTVTCTNRGTTTENIWIVYEPSPDINRFKWTISPLGPNYGDVPPGGRVTAKFEALVPDEPGMVGKSYSFVFHCRVNGAPWSEFAQTAFRINVVAKRTCVIATATYGSELSPEVQLLRNFRDRGVVQTFSGSQFMELFNSFYYSFSPNVARVILTNNGLRTVMRYVLYPLIGILWAAQEIYGALAFNPEGAVLVAGLFASGMVGLVYALPFTSCACLLARRVTGRRLTLRHAAMSMAVLGVALGLTLVSELTGSALLMQFSTGVAVLDAVALPGIGFSAWAM
jgi:peptide/nickel transport system substrate-binding protein